MDDLHAFWLLLLIYKFRKKVLRHFILYRLVVGSDTLQSPAGGLRYSLVSY